MCINMSERCKQMKKKRNQSIRILGTRSQRFHAFLNWFLKANIFVRSSGGRIAISSSVRFSTCIQIISPFQDRRIVISPVLTVQHCFCRHPRSLLLRPSKVGVGWRTVGEQRRDSVTEEDPPWNNQEEDRRIELLVEGHPWREEAFRRMKAASSD